MSSSAGEAPSNDTMCSVLTASLFLSSQHSILFDKHLLNCTTITITIMTSLSITVTSICMLLCRHYGYSFRWCYLHMLHHIFFIQRVIIRRIRLINCDHLYKRLSFKSTIYRLNHVCSLVIYLYYCTGDKHIRKSSLLIMPSGAK